LFFVFLCICYNITNKYVYRGPASKIVLKFFLAIWCGLLGSLFTFPGLRVSKMHWDMLK